MMNHMSAAETVTSTKNGRTYTVVNTGNGYYLSLLNERGEVVWMDTPYALRVMFGITLNTLKKVA